MGVWGGEGHVAPLPLPLGAGSRLPNRPEVIRKRFILVSVIALYILLSSGILTVAVYVIVNA